MVHPGWSRGIPIIGPAAVAIKVPYNTCLLPRVVQPPPRDPNTRTRTVLLTAPVHPSPQHDDCSLQNVILIRVDITSLAPCHCPERTNFASHFWGQKLTSTVESSSLSFCWLPDGLVPKHMTHINASMDTTAMAHVYCSQWLRQT